MERDLLKPADIAMSLGVSRSRVYQLMRDGSVPFIRMGKAVRVPRRAWERWLEIQDDMAAASVKGAGDKKFDA